jgi:hypothetical protein
MSKYRTGSVFLSLALLMWNVVFFHNIVVVGPMLAICFFHGSSVLAFALGLQAILMDISSNKIWLTSYFTWSWVHLIITTIYTCYMTFLTMLWEEFKCTTFCHDSSKWCVLTIVYLKLVLSVGLVFALYVLSFDRLVDVESATIQPPWHTIAEPLPRYSSKKAEVDPPAYTISKEL